MQARRTSRARRPLLVLAVAAAVLGGLQLAGADLSALLPRSATGAAVVLGLVAAVVGWSALARLFVRHPGVRTGVVLLPVLALSAWLVVPLLADRTVQEDLLSLAPPPAAAAVAAPAAPAAPTTAAAPAAAPPAPVAPPSPAAPQVRTLGSGELRPLDGHRASGTASLVDVGGTTAVRLADLDSSRSPDVRVWLVPTGAEDPSSGGVELGELKGNKGSSNYVVPADVDLDAYGAVLLWCRAFSTAIGAADLEQGR